MLCNGLSTKGSFKNIEQEKILIEVIKKENILEYKEERYIKLFINPVKTFMLLLQLVIMAL